MRDVNDVIRTRTQQVHDQVRWIQAHYRKLGRLYGVGPGRQDRCAARSERPPRAQRDGRGGQDPYAARAERQEIIDKATEDAKSLLLRPSILKHLCPALRTVSGDVFEISKVLVGVLVPLSVAGAISMPWNPLVIAAGAFLILRAGITAICKGIEAEGGKPEPEDAA